MLRRLRAALNSPYPFEPSLLSLLLYGLGSGLFIWAFFLLLEPLGFSLLPAAPRRALFAGYGLVTGLAVVANGLLLPRVLPRLFREESWTLGRQVLWMCWVTLAIGVGAYLLSGAVCARYGIPAHWVRLRTIVFDTFVIAVIPITVINLANSARLARRNARVVAATNRRLAAPALPGLSAPAATDRVRIVAENGRDVLQIALGDLLAVQAEENYVRAHVRRGSPALPLLRSSLARVERQLHPLHPRLFRCHRAWIVNTAQIAKVDGNAQGLRLALKDSEVAVPVARRCVREFRRAIESL